MFPQEDPSVICRDENCKREDLHEPHEVKALKEKVHRPSRRIAKNPYSARPLWDLPAPLALDESIERAVSSVQPKHFAYLVTELENDYGSLGKNRKSGYQRVHRHLRALIKAGRVLRIDVGDMLYAYLAPSSRVAKDISYVREKIKELIEVERAY